MAHMSLLIRKHGAGDKRGQRDGRPVLMTAASSETVSSVSSPEVSSVCVRRLRGTRPKQREGRDEVTSG